MSNRVGFAVAVTVLAFSPLAHAGAPDPGNRNASLAHVCQGGTKKGVACLATHPFCNNNGDCNAGSVCDTGANQCVPDCPGGTCVFAFNQKTYKGTLTATFDDFVSDPQAETFQGQALTVLLEVKANGADRIFAETYQAPGGGDLMMGIWNNPVTEDALLSEPISGFLFQNTQPNLAEALRIFLGETGTPIVVATSGNIQKSDGRGNAACTGGGTPDPCCTGGGTGTCDALGKLGSVIRLKIKFRFVAP
jgi:hypothetical protein